MGECECVGGLGDESKVGEALRECGDEREGECEGEGVGECECVGG